MRAHGNAAASLAHDLGNVLMVLKSMRMLADNVDISVREELLTRSIYRLELMRLHQSVAAGRPPEIRGTCLARNICDEAQQRVALVYGKRVRFEAVSVTDTLFPGDIAIWSQVILLLVDNSVRHSKREQPFCHLLCGSGNHQTYLRFSDDGLASDNDQEEPSSERAGYGLPTIQMVTKCAGGTIFTDRTQDGGWLVQLEFAHNKENL